MISIQQAAEKLVLVSGHRFSDAESLRNQMPLQVLRIENPVRPQRLKAPSKLALSARLKACALIRTALKAKACPATMHTCAHV
jgi:hypothetical protein